MRNICAGIVLYNPYIDRFEKNLMILIRQVDTIVIVDNGSNNYSCLLNRIAENTDNICIIHNPQNEGIAKALNQLCEIAKENGYDWILTLDQDTCCPENLIDECSKDLAAHIAVVSPNIIYRHNESFSDCDRKGIREVDWVITSGSLTNIKAWQSVGGFDEKLFIDAVDRDFCIRARKKGYRILKNYNVAILHELGNLKCRKILGKVIYVTNHSKIRKYYMTRNAIYLDKKLGMHYSVVYILKLVLKTLVFEEQKTGKIQAIFQGIRDGIKMKKVL